MLGGDSDFKIGGKEMITKMKRVYHVANIIIVFITVFAFIVEFTKLKSIQPYGVVLLYTAMSIGAIVSLAYLVSLTPLKRGESHLAVYYAHIVFIFLALLAVLLDILLYFVAQNLFTCIEVSNDITLENPSCIKRTKALFYMDGILAILLPLWFFYLSTI